MYEELKARYNPEGSPLREYQTKQLRVLREFDAFCRQHQLRYSLAYGTLLGAVRHQGYIPWDDDLDVIMTREEYTKLTRLAVDGHLTDTLCLGVTLYALLSVPEDNISMDLFIMDSSPDNRLLRSLKVFFARLLALLIKCKLKLRAGRLSRFKWWYVFLPLALPFPLTSLQRCHSAISQWFNRMGGGKGAFNVTLNGTSMRYPSDIMDNYSDIEFEGEKYMAVADTDTFLKVVYGNYMAIPAERNRQNHDRINNQ